MEELVGIVALITLFGSLFGIMYMYFTTRHRERMALIEKNADPALFRNEGRGAFRTISIKVGMVLAGAGIGILMGNILDMVTNLESEVPYFSMILIFSGAGLFLSYFVAKKYAGK
jgi:hypothetical protein